MSREWYQKPYANTESLYEGLEELSHEYGAYWDAKEVEDLGQLGQLIRTVRHETIRRMNNIILEHEKSLGEIMAIQTGNDDIIEDIQELGGDDGQEITQD